MDEKNSRHETKITEQSENETSVVIEPASDKRSGDKKRRGHRGAFFLGLLIVAFAVFGVWQAASWGVGKIQAVADNSAKIAEYEKFLEPFVVIDPTPFDDVSSAESIDLLDAAISTLIYNSDKLNTYEVYEGEVTGLLVPQADVEEYFKMMFGNEVKLAHTDVADSFYGVMYSSEKQAYIIPITSVDPTYTPKVYAVEKQGSSIILTVGYIGGTEWAQLVQGQYTAPEPSKYMKITLREDDSGYHIGSLQATEAVEIAEPEETVTTTTTTTTTTRPAASNSSEAATDENGSTVEDGSSENSSSQVAAETPEENAE